MRYIPGYSLMDSNGFKSGDHGTFQREPLIVETRDDPMFSSGGDPRSQTLSPSFTREEDIQRRFYESESQRLSLEKEVANLRDQLNRMARMSNLGLSGQVPLTSDHFTNYKQTPSVTFTGTKSSSQNRVPASQELEQLYKFQNLMGDLGDMVDDSGQLAAL